MMRDYWGGSPYQQQPQTALDWWLSQLGQLPQPYQVFGPGQPPLAPVYRPGWGEVWQRLLPWNQMPGPPPVPEGYLEDANQWPPGRIPFGSRF